MEDRPKRRKLKGNWKGVRQRIYRRDGGRCELCGRKLPKTGFVCGHRVDKIAGGGEEDANLAVMCHSCDKAKPIHRSMVEYITYRDAIRGQLTRNPEDYLNPTEYDLWVSLA